MTNIRRNTIKMYIPRVDFYCIVDFDFSKEDMETIFCLGDYEILKCDRYYYFDNKIKKLRFSKEAHCYIKKDNFISPAFAYSENNVKQLGTLTTGYLDTFFNSLSREAWEERDRDIRERKEADRIKQEKYLKELEEKEHEKKVEFTNLFDDYLQKIKDGSEFTISQSDFLSFKEVGLIKVPLNLSRTLKNIETLKIKNGNIVSASFYGKSSFKAMDKVFKLLSSKKE